MMRAENDTWDLASGVGATATMVAAARAVATRSVDPLISDPFAEPLVQAVGIDFFARLASGELDPTGTEDAPVLGVQRMVDVMAVRTRYFDEFFTHAAEAGIRQAVILASGLDSRAYRLGWPTGMTVFEIDQPGVMEFKTTAMADLGATPTADRRMVAIDLRQNWPAALRRARFRADLPTAWIAEGLLGYLPAEAQDRLLDDVTMLSAEGSKFSADAVPNLPQPEQDHFRERILTLIASWRNHGFDVDMTDMVYLGERNYAPAYLDANGWETDRVTTSELFVANGLHPVGENDDDRAPFALAVYLCSTLKQDRTVRHSVRELDKESTNNADQASPSGVDTAIPNGALGMPNTTAPRRPPR
jgi:methyltransferase (TIGR00027 family)